jgi:hypothetical protein
MHSPAAWLVLPSQTPIPWLRQGSPRAGTPLRQAHPRPRSRSCLPPGRCGALVEWDGAPPLCGALALGDRRWPSPPRGGAPGARAGHGRATPRRAQPQRGAVVAAAAGGAHPHVRPARLGHARHVATVGHWGRRPGCRLGPWGATRRDPAAVVAAVPMVAGRRWLPHRRGILGDHPTPNRPTATRVALAP